METSSFNLRPFQQRVLKAVLAGQSVLVQAPTGSGKTRAALAPFVANLSVEGTQLPLTCRYSIPVRALANQFYNEYRNGLKKLGLEERYSSRRDGRRGFNFQPVAIQTGEQPDDPALEAALTFCTIDQTLASFLSIPYSLGKRSANINVGGVIGSYLVFDEFHLYPLTRDNKSSWGARTTTLQMLHMLRVQNTRLTPFALMTATFSSHLLKEIASMLDAQVIDIKHEKADGEDEDELTVLNAGRERRFTVHDAMMTAQTILDQHVDCSLVINNTVLRAQQTFLALRDQIKHDGRDVRVVLLHSRFADADRAAKQAELEAAMGKHNWKGDVYHGPNIIVVATQVVEVGLDISARTLHTEAAPANSIIQRAGRCARFASQHGFVHLYPIPANEQGRVVYAPYDKETTEATLAAFGGFGAQPVGFREEQQVIDQVHGDEDAELLRQFKQDRPQIHRKMYEGFSVQHNGIVSSLIRDVQQTTLLIHDDPNAAITEQPWTWQTFRLHPETLKARWEALQDAAYAAQTWNDAQPMAWQAKLDESTMQEENQRHAARYRWEPFTHRDHVAHALMIALSPQVATYDQDLGLLLNDGRLAYTWPMTPYRSQPVASRRKQRSSFDYRQESFAEHIGGLIDAYGRSRLQHEVRYIAAKLEQALGRRAGAVDHAIRLAIACHDIGKLGTGWQRWSKTWQTLLVDTYPQQADTYRPHKYPFAHTDFIPREHRDLQRDVKPPRPHHACESAYLAWWLIDQSLQNERLRKATVAAIARHHTPGAQQYGSITLIPEARSEMHAVLERVSRGQRWSYNLADLDEQIDDTSMLDGDDMTVPWHGMDEGELWVYFVIVRALRLADQRSFEYVP